MTMVLACVIVLTRVLVSTLVMVLTHLGRQFFFKSPFVKLSDFSLLL